MDPPQTPDLPKEMRDPTHEDPRGNQEPPDSECFESFCDADVDLKEFQRAFGLCSNQMYLVRHGK